jgi:hypothetical protein
MTQKRKMWLTIGGGVLALCLLLTCAGGIAGYFYRDQILAILGLAQTQRIAQILPEETEFYWSITPNIQNVSGYQNLKTLYLDNPEVKAALDDLQADLTEETDMSFAEDIQPWLGTEIVLAAPNFQAAFAGTNETPAFVLAAHSRDRVASDKFIEKFLATAAAENQPFTAQSYQEVTLQVQNNDFGEDTYLASFAELVVISNGESLIKEMIDRSQGNSEQPALVNSARFQRVTGQLPSEAITTIYMDYDGLFATVLNDIPFQLSAEQRQSLEAFEGIGLAGTLQPDGIQLDFAMTFDPAKMTEQFRTSLEEQVPSPNTIFANLPAEAMFVYNTNNLSRIWSQAQESLSGNPDFKEGLADLQDELGIDLNEDIFSWMTGEVALVFVEASPIDEFAPPLGGYLIIGTDDVAKAQAALDKVVGSLLEQELLPELEPATIDGVEMMAMTDFFTGKVQGGYGFHKNYFFLAFSEEAIKSLSSAAATPLTGSKNFSAVQARLPRNNYGYLYADIDQIRAVVESQLSDFEREDYETTVQPFLVPVHAFGASANADGVADGVSKGAFFILISE